MRFAPGITTSGAGLVIIDPKRGENILFLIIYLLFAAIKDIFTFFLHKIKDFF